MGNQSLLSSVLRIAVNFAVGELRFQKWVTVFSNRIIACIIKQLQRLSALSFFQSALLRCWQPFSVMSLLTEYKHSYWGITISGAATVSSRDVCSRYLRFCCWLIYLLITEVEDSQSPEIGSAEGDTPLFSDAVSICIKPLLLNHNYMSSAVGCLPSLPSTALRTAGRSAAEILLLTESLNAYAGSNH